MLFHKLRDEKEIEGKAQDPMKLRNGYLVRALNELASLTPAFKSIDPSYPIPTRARASIHGNSDHQRNQKKFPTHRGSENLVLLSAPSATMDSLSGERLDFAKASEI